MKPLLLILALITSSPLQAANFSLNATGGEPLYQTVLTKDIYQASRTDNLQDLIIQNAAGEQVPYALLPYEVLHPTQSVQESTPLVVFPMQENAANTQGKVNIQLETSADKTTLNVSNGDANTLSKPSYLFDLGEKHPKLNKLNVDWQGAEGQLMAVELLSSSNLQDWQNIGQAVLFKSTAAGKSIVQNSIELTSATENRYLQLRLVEPNSDFKLTSVNTEYNTMQSVPKPWLWQDLTFLNRSTANQGEINLDFEATGRYPASQLRVHLPQQNTITSAQVLVRNKDDAPWQLLNIASLYRLNKKDKELTNPDIAISIAEARYWRLQFNQTSGGIGAENPSLSVGWLPHTVLWNARGQAPFTLQVGEAPQVVNAVGAGSLIPDYHLEKAQALPQAALAKRSDAAHPNDQANSWVSAPDYKRWLLWLGLVLGVCFLAGMVYSLLKNQQQ